MALKKDPAKPGFWSDPSWKAGSVGTFALVIGVSRYRHLTGGPNPVPKTYDLGQLFVSALTAYRFFCWLRDTYKSPAKLGRCWLLLAPSDAELEAEPALGDHQLEPTFDNISKAIAAWHKSMAELPAPTAEKSRAFFVFSGHGVEVSAPDKQVLLPSDYLDPEFLTLDRAISTENLWAGLGALAVRDQFMFLDACRNDSDELRAMDTFDGSTVLPVVRGARNAQRNAPKFYASGPGSEAWQPKTPNGGPSIYGQAVLEGLQALAGFEPEKPGDPCAVRVFRLQEFLARRVVELLTAHPPVPPYPAVMGGMNAISALITDVACPDVPLVGAGPGFAVGDGRGSGDEVISTTLLDTTSMAAPGGAPAAALGHAVLGSEQVTAIWASAKLYNLRLDQPEDVGQALKVYRVEHGADTRMYRFVLGLQQSQDPHWLALSDYRTTFVSMLPGDLIAPRFVLELNVDYDAETLHGARRAISSLQVSLSSESAGPLGEAASLWERYRAINVAEAVASIKDMHQLETTLAGKLESPLAAAVAAVVLIRAQQWNLLHDWLINLTNWFPYLPDGPVLRAKQVLETTPGRKVPPEVIQMFLKLRERGLPWTAEALGYAVQVADEIAGVKVLKKDQREAAATLRKEVRRASSRLRSAGLFTTFAVPLGTLEPSLISIPTSVIS
jgi:hypothetical protein